MVYQNKEEEILITTRYFLEDIKDYEDFLNKLFVGLKYYENKHKDFKFKITYNRNYIELKTIKLNESVN